jgi:hypothetical protein
LELANFTLQSLAAKGLDLLCRRDIRHALDGANCAMQQRSAQAGFV